MILLALFIQLESQILFCLVIIHCFLFIFCFLVYLIICAFHCCKANILYDLFLIVSGLSGSPETAQDQVSVGMGLLAGSTVMLLTVIWGTCIIVGKCDLQNSIAIDNQDTKGFNLIGNSTN